MLVCTTIGQRAPSAKTSFEWYPGSCVVEQKLHMIHERHTRTTACKSCLGAWWWVRWNPRRSCFTSTSAGTSLSRPMPAMPFVQEISEPAAPGWPVLHRITTRMTIDVLFRDGSQHRPWKEREVWVWFTCIFRISSGWFLGSSRSSSGVFSASSATGILGGVEHPNVSTVWSSWVSPIQQICARLTWASFPQLGMNRLKNCLKPPSRIWKANITWTIRLEVGNDPYVFSCPLHSWKDSTLFCLFVPANV